MRVKALRKLLWTANTLLVLGIVAYALFFFILHGVRRTGITPPETLLGKQNLPEAAPDVQTDKLPPFLTFGAIHDLVIDGDPPVEVKPVEAGPEAPPVPPLAQDYDLIWVAAVTNDPLESWAHLLHKGTKKLITVKGGEFVEFVRTQQRRAKDWKLVLVATEPPPWRAEFVQEETGERVTLEQVRQAPGELGKGAGEGPKEIGIAEGPGVGKIPKQPRDRPTRELVEIPGKPGEYEVPAEERAWWGDYGEDELTTKVALETVKVEGKDSGLMFKSVEKDSMPARRGIKSGDVLKSVNGRPMNTRQQVLNYLNGEGKDLKSYTVIIERDGKEISRTYHVKPKK